MRPRLMYRDDDLDLEVASPPQTGDVTQDLELDTLVGAMAAGDGVVAAVCRAALVHSLVEEDAIRYRQDILRDLLEHRDLAADLYAVATDAVDAPRRVYSAYFGRSPELLMMRAREVLGTLLANLERLHEIAEQHADAVRSEGLRTLLATLVGELAPSYLAEVRDELRRLAFRDGLLASARLGTGNVGTDYVLRTPRARKRSLRAHLDARRSRPLTVVVAERDEAGGRTLRGLRERSLERVADAVTGATNHVIGFFALLRNEVAFYLGCLELETRLTARHEPTCFPEPVTGRGPILSGTAVYDVCLSLQSEEQVVGNDISADGDGLVMVTGANRGGKSTFLRSIGLAQLMMQCGMFVAASSFRADVAPGVFTHYRREEDRDLLSGKLDEELHRMSDIVGHLRPGCIVLCNESFAATNETEGSEIAGQILRGLRGRGIKVIYVTHLFELARRLHDQGRDDTLFLRAERLADGTRTFRLVEAPPLETSFGADLYTRIFDPDRNGPAPAG